MFLIFRRLPLRTHLVHPGESVPELVKQYIVGIAQPGDVIAVAESVVAIAQDRAILPETVKVSWLARLLCCYAGKGGSLAMPFSMQLAINEVGTFRIIAGVLAAAVGKLLGRKGDFYRVAGRQLSLIDDLAGTLPPFNRYVVLGPKDPDKVARAIRDLTGVDAIIVDANDAGSVDIIGAATAYRPEFLAKWLIDNPAGNDDQQTPIVLLKAVC